MRRVGLILSVAVLATFLVSIATLAAGAQTGTSSSQLPVSQGTYTGLKSTSAERSDMAEEEKLPDYSQVVDSSRSPRFDASGWKRGGSDSWAHGGDFVSSGTSTTDARFKLRAPTKGDYAIYAWWPAREGNSSAARFGVKTAGGMNWQEVDQTRYGGTWVKLGTFEMNSGDNYVVRVSPGDQGEVIADAVALVRGGASAPPNDLAPAEGGQIAASSTENTYTASSTRSERRALIRFGRRHLGTPYRLSPPAPCWAYHKEDCSCFTHLVFRHFGKKLQDSPIRQYWHKDRKWVARTHLKRGDLVFFKEHGWNHPITHVAMYSGNGFVLHASAYYGKVVESKMKYLRGYFGARRVRHL
jgi:cell wall-associated NlpC family hydrolase